MAQPNKKPNSFSKGMMSDIDANALPPDSYKEAVGGRLITRDDNSFVLKNAQGNTLLDSIELNSYEFFINNFDSQLASFAQSLNGTNASYQGFTVRLYGTDPSFSYEATYFKYDESVFNGLSYPDSNPNVWLTFAIYKLLSNPDVQEKVNIFVFSNNIFHPQTPLEINVIDKTSQSTSLQIKAHIKYTDNNLEAQTSVQTYEPTFSFNNNSHKYKIVGVASFSDYSVLLTRYSEDKCALWKVTLNNDGTLNQREVIAHADLGFLENVSLRVEVSEENEHFHRIYWTDGIQPLRTINLKEEFLYYTNLVADDLNVFKESKLLAPVVQDIIGGGNVSCGAHSYCYRLVTTDGKTSRVSNITNPINIVKTVPNTSYHETLGGSLSTNSSNAVSIRIDDIDNSYGTIQLIDITYTSAEGAITANIISESQITSSSFNYTHNGNETKVSISIGELLRSHVVSISVTYQ